MKHVRTIHNKTTSLSANVRWSALHVLNTMGGYVKEATITQELK